MLFRRKTREQDGGATKIFFCTDVHGSNVRSQIRAVEHPERFYPAVDRDWQQLQLLKEGYDKPLP